MEKRESQCFEAWFYSVKRANEAEQMFEGLEIHFIECTWGGCCNSIYQNFLVPYFDSSAVLDYVLRSPVVRGDTVLEDGIPAPKMFPELLLRLRGIRSPNIQQYLAKRFQS